MINIGKRIRVARQNLGMSLEKLGDATGSAKSYIYELETGAAANPSAFKLSRIADALGVSIDFLLGRKHPDLAIEDEFDRELYEKYLELDYEKKDFIRRAVDLLSLT